MSDTHPFTSLETLRIVDLVEYHAALDQEIRLDQAQAWFRGQDRHFAAVVDQGRYVGLLSRNHLEDRLGGRFGQALWGRRTVDHLARREALIARPEWSLRTLLQAVLRRVMDFHDDVPLVAADGTFLGMFTVARVAATQSELLEQQVGVLHEQSRELQALERRIAQEEKEALLARLLGGVAHEMNNKLAPAKGFADLLEERLRQTQAPQPLQKHCQTISTTIDEATALLGQLLNLSRPPALNPVSQDFRTLVENAVALVQFRLRKCDVDLELRLPSKPVAVLADGPQIKQVLVNLMLNAMDAMEGAPRRCLTVDLDTEDGWAGLRIRDTGHGIHPSHQERIFEPFFTTKGSERGTGLGLSICRSIVQQHQGGLHFQSEPGSGTQFEVRLALDRSLRPVKSELQSAPVVLKT